jgi:signal peptidase I
MNKRLKTMLTRVWKEWGSPILVVVAIMIPLRSSLADWNDVPTGSMKPTILVGDRIFVNKLAYDLKVPLTTWHIAKWGNPARGDIVVCYSPADGKRLVKRVVGIPGDTLAMQNGRLIVNSIEAKYTTLDQAVVDNIPKKEQQSRLFAEEDVDGLSHAVMFMPSRQSPRSFDTLLVPEGKYVVMGDNRDNSFDSRFFGFVDRKQIVGQGVAVVCSRNFENYHIPRQNRWFRKLQ